MTMRTSEKPWFLPTVMPHTCPVPTIPSTIPILFGACTRREERTSCSATAQCIFSAAALIPTRINTWLPSPEAKCLRIGEHPIRAEESIHARAEMVCAVVLLVGMRGLQQVEIDRRVDRGSEIIG